MPIFADPERRLSTTTKEPEPTRLGTMNRKLSEESIRTEFCDGPLPDTPPRDTSPKQARESLSVNMLETRTSNRAELIERIKRGESPTWVPNQAVRMMSDWYTAVGWDLRCVSNMSQCLGSLFWFEGCLPSRM